MSDQWMVSLYMIMSQNGMYHFGEGDLLMFDEIPISNIELPDQGMISNVLWHIPAREAYAKVASF